MIHAIEVLLCLVLAIAIIDLFAGFRLTKTVKFALTNRVYRVL